MTSDHHDDHAGYPLALCGAELVHIADYDREAQARPVCPGCGRPLVGVQGEHSPHWYFRHTEGPGCAAPGYHHACATLTLAAVLEGVRASGALPAIVNHPRLSSRLRQALAEDFTVGRNLALPDGGTADLALLAGPQVAFAVQVYAGQAEPAAGHARGWVEVDALDILADPLHWQALDPDTHEVLERAAPRTSPPARPWWQDPLVFGLGVLGCAAWLYHLTQGSRRR